MKRDNEKIKWLLSCSKNQSIYIDWLEEDFKDTYKELEGVNDKSATKLLELEEQRENGINITECLDMFTKEDTLEDFQGDKCDTKSEAKIQFGLTRLPEILMIHLKRFDFIGGQLK